MASAMSQYLATHDAKSLYDVQRLSKIMWFSKKLKTAEFEDEYLQFIKENIIYDNYEIDFDDFFRYTIRGSILTLSGREIKFMSHKCASKYDATFNIWLYTCTCKDNKYPGYSWSKCGDHENWHFDTCKDENLYEVLGIPEGYDIHNSYEAWKEILEPCQWGLGNGDDARYFE